MIPRKLRVLCMCGGHSCTEVMKFQVSGLRAVLGKNAVEWTFIEGSKDWFYFEGEPVVSEMEERLANGKQLKNWFMDEPHTPEDDKRLRKDKQFDPEVDVEYFDIPEVVHKLRSYMMENGPFDVLIAFSQACIMVQLLIGTLRQEGIENMPWRISLFFSG